MGVPGQVEAQDPKQINDLLSSLYRPTTDRVSVRTQICAALSNMSSQARRSYYESCNPSQLLEIWRSIQFGLKQLNADTPKLNSCLQDFRGPVVLKTLDQAIQDSYGNIRDPDALNAAKQDRLTAMGIVIQILNTENHTTWPNIYGLLSPRTVSLIADSANKTDSGNYARYLLSNFNYDPNSGWTKRPPKPEPTQAAEPIQTQKGVFIQPVSNGGYEINFTPPIKGITHISIIPSSDPGPRYTIYADGIRVETGVGPDERLVSYINQSYGPLITGGPLDNTGGKSVKSEVGSEIAAFIKIHQ